MMRKVTLLTLVLVWIANTMAAQPNAIFVKAGDAQGLLTAIEQANQWNEDSAHASRLFIFLPNGTYDLGDRVLTTLIGHNVAIIGESMNGTIIVNKPAIENEGISKTATLRLMTSDTYLQDLTLKNALEYYKAGAAGRAVCLHDKGTRTICKRVRMLSYQDTYYSDNLQAQTYFEDSEIHGTIDFICGAGDVYFNRCNLVTEKRNLDGTGCNVIAAPRTADTPWGYVFESCTVYNRMSSFLYARGWHTHPRCAWLNTRLMSPEKLEATRYEPKGMRTVNSDFFEYHTMDANGQDITPKSNIITFMLNEEQRSLETILTPREARRFQLKKIFPDWRPEKIVTQMSKTIRQMKKLQNL
jgi:pectin methylesterase-like acyl-CoA thioesterase